MRAKVVKYLALNAARAGATKVELLDSANEMVRDRASSRVGFGGDPAGHRAIAEHQRRTESRLRNRFVR
jgi:hypothetical protein